MKTQVITIGVPNRFFDGPAPAPVVPITDKITELKNLLLEAEAAGAEIKKLMTLAEEFVTMFKAILGK